MTEILGLKRKWYCGKHLKEIRGIEMGYRKKYKKQLALWVAGTSIHMYKGICCPDFSCCKPELKAPKEERELFQELYLTKKHSEYERMLMMFLGRALPLITKKKVYIAGGKD